MVHKNKCLEELIKYGFFNEGIPDDFNTKSLLKILDKIPDLIGERAFTPSESTKISVYKNKSYRRDIFIPNIVSFLEICIYVQNNFEFLLYLSQSKNSQSSIINKKNDVEIFNMSINGYLDEFYYLNSINLKEKLRIRSDFNQSLNENIVMAIGSIWQLNLDIDNFYNSIYTHSISWAVLGKKEAKSIYSKNKNTDINIDCYEKLDEFDTRIRNMNMKESYGIITGPFISRIFSEILLANIDKRFQSKKYKFYRYVDDYKFYFSNESDAKKSKKEIENILGEYNLKLNDDKTKFIEFPFNIKKDINYEYNNRYKQKGILGVLNESMAMFKNQEKGAIKYALKFISDKDIKNEDVTVIFSLLFNLMLLDPNNSKLIINFIGKNNEKFSKMELSSFLNEEIRKNIKINKEHEAIFCLELLLKLNGEIDENSFEEILISRNDLLIIMALEYFKNKYKKISFNEDIFLKLYNQLLTETYAGPRWLLLYQIKSNNYLGKFNESLIKKIEENTNEFKSGEKIISILNKFSKEHVSFYTCEY